MEEKKKNEPAEIPWKIDLWKGSYKRMFEYYGQKPLICVLAATLQEVVDRMEKVNSKLGYEILFVSKDVQGFQKSNIMKFWLSDPVNTINFLKMRNKNENVVWFTIHSSVNWQSLERLRSVLSDAKIVSYVYDWQNLFVPKDKLHVWNQYAENGSIYAGEETKVIELALEGKMCDAIMHGDFGPNWPYLTSKPIPCGSFFMPRSCPGSLYQKPPPLDVENRCIYIGTVVDKKRFAQQDLLFSETHIENLFEKICNSGYKIDLFTLVPRKEVVDVFREKFPHNKVRIHQGMILKNLLPIVAGRFRFGLMLYEHTTDITEAHDAVSLPTKLFTYLAIGVPILVSSRLKAVSRFVKENNCGIVFERGEECDVESKIKKYDYSKLIDGVLSCRDQFKSENYDDGFISVIKNVMDLPYEKSVAKRIKNNGTNSSRT